MEQNALLHGLIDLIQFKDTYQQQSSGLSPQDMYVLERIHFQGSVQIRDLSKTYGIPPSTLTGILDRLERKKYICRERKREDRRAIDLAATVEGEVVLKKHLEEDRLFSSHLLSGLADEKRELFLELLSELLGRVKKEHLFDRTAG